MARPEKGVTFWDRVNAYVVKHENGCHLFNGHLDECGYGRIRFGKKLIRIHRAKWELHFGEIPKDELGISYEINHIDGNKKNNLIENLYLVSFILFSIIFIIYNSFFVKKKNIF